MTGMIATTTTTMTTTTTTTTALHERSLAKPVLSLMVLLGQLNRTCKISPMRRLHRAVVKMHPAMSRVKSIWPCALMCDTDLCGMAKRAESLPSLVGFGVRNNGNRP